jgi:hypothetical protein
MEGLPLLGAARFRYHVAGCSARNILRDRAQDYSIVCALFALFAYRGFADKPKWQQKYEITALKIHKRSWSLVQSNYDGTWKLVVGVVK